ncbi:MAG: 2-C-methyl-D-erythritol 4-phosphate cytidylyltransferase, partial [Pseudomonadota bacterium]
MTRIAVLVVAAGRGSRAQTFDSCPKQYATIGGKRVLSRTLRTFLLHPEISSVTPVIHADDGDLLQETLNELHELPSAKLKKCMDGVFGGPTRQSSVHAGLEALANTEPAPNVVLIHDGARPFIDADAISRVIAAIRPGYGAIAALPVVDTLKRANANGVISDTITRANLW